MAKFYFFDLVFMILGVMFCFFGASLISSLATYYEEEDRIPSYLINTIKYNLESTPIMDILSDDECSNSRTSNVLGYYYGYDEGFKYNDNSYGEDKREEICKSYNKDECIKVKAQDAIPYKIFKGKILCTSKRPNKNYFDYIESSVELSQFCPHGQRKCGKLDGIRDLCVNNNEKCPINDIVYNNQSEYLNDSIIYTTVKIKDNEFLHYTNEKTNNYIITNLTVIGGSGKGYPCGANDNNRFIVNSYIENNYNCQGDYKLPKYYYYKNLSTVT